MSKKVIVLKSSDGESFEVEESVAIQSVFIANMIEDDCTEGGITLPNITGSILAKVIEYCMKHAVVVDGGGGDGDGGDSSSSSEDLKKWDAEFMQIDQSTIFDLILASNFLNIPSLLDLTCQTVANMITACKDAKEIREKFSIENDFTPEEEEEIRKENQWAFE